MTLSGVAGEVRVFAQYREDFRLSADVVVVGSGPGGAVVAKELAERGVSVVLLEEGPPLTPADYELEGGISMARTMREGGLRSTRGTVLPSGRVQFVEYESLQGDSPYPVEFNGWAIGKYLIGTWRHQDRTNTFILKRR